MKKMTEIQIVRFTLFFFIVCSLLTFIGFISTAQLTSSRHIQRIEQRYKDIEEGNMVKIGTEMIKLSDFPNDIADEYRWSVVDAHRLLRRLYENKYAAVFEVAMLFEFIISFVIVSWMAIRIGKSSQKDSAIGKEM